MVATSPWQMLILESKVMALVSLTVKIDEVPEQPEASVTVTAIGLSAMVASMVEVVAPVDHEYVAYGLVVESVVNVTAQY